ncbi:MAG: DUF1552 domain-containing protein [Myxococcota bacterium]
MKTTSFRGGLSRRTVLRGAVGGLGAAVALPPLEAMLNTHGTAHADGSALPTRFGVWYWGNGTRLDKWIPVEEGPGYTPPELLQPFTDAGVGSMVSVVTGLAVPFGNQAVHDVGRASMLSGSFSLSMPAVGLAGNATLPSVDQIAAETLSAGASYRSLEVGVSEAGFNLQPDTASVSWIDPVSPLPAEFSPQQLYERLFSAGVDPDTSFTDSRLSVLDVVAADAGALRGRLGAVDRARLDAHLEGIRAIEHRLQATPPACAVPGDPGDPQPDAANNEPIGARSRLMSDLVALALVCDLTRVFNFRFTAQLADTFFSEIGAPETYHTMTHNAARTAEVGEVLAFTMQEMAYLLQRLAETPEGDGTLLDHSIVYGTSELAEGLTHEVVDMPVLVAGGGNGRLRPGVHVRSHDQRSTSIVPFTLLRAAQCDVESFGEGEGMTTETLDALLA